MYQEEMDVQGIFADKVPVDFLGKILEVFVKTVFCFLGLLLRIGLPGRLIRLLLTAFLRRFFRSRRFYGLVVRVGLSVQDLVDPARELVDAVIQAAAGQQEGYA